MDSKTNSLQGQGLTKRFETGLLRGILAVGEATGEIPVIVDLF